MTRFVLAAVSLAAAAAAGAGEREWRLRYDRPAEQWVEALPVGNGRMGAMVFGGVGRERLQFNEQNVWTGGPHSYAHSGAHEHLGEIRRLLFEGRQREAEQLAARQFMSRPLRQQDYQPLGDVTLRLGHGGALPADYRRELDLGRAVATTTYTIDGARYEREVFASHPDRAVVVRLTCDKPGGLAFEAELTSPHDGSETKPTDRGALLLSGRVNDRARPGEGVPPSEVRFAACLQVLSTDGDTETGGGVVRVSDASQATIVLTAATNVVDFRDLSAQPGSLAQRDLERISEWPYADLLERHVEDHRSLFDRVGLTLGPPPEEADAKPTDQRLLDAKRSPDNDLAALVFHYGRYLLIASSRPGGQPANLQGLWNEDLDPAWGSKYTTNINAEMNYWLAEPCGLHECHEPLFDAIAEIAQAGQEVAREHYDAPGWVLHHNFDRWRGAAPINASNHGIWPSGGAWLCEHLWLHYAYTHDEAFLRDRAYPLMKGAAEFFLDYLVEDPRSETGWLISGPSNSPEQGGLAMGPAMDHQIIRSLFGNTIRAAEALGVDESFRERLAEARRRVAPNQVGRLGQLQEWLEDVDDPDNRHRHVSHLWGLHPGGEITPDTPALFDAARRSLDLRGDGGTGWSRAWKVNFWARLRDGDRAWRVLDGLMTLTGSPKTDYNGGGLYPNLFDAHPPFQIDGNLGATSGVCEMLVQSHRRTDDGARLIDVLPALPEAWPEGRLTGLRTRDGFVVDLAWSDGRLDHVTIHSRLGEPAVVACGDRRHVLDLAAGESVRLGGELTVAEGATPGG
ncbi:glycoside hydrolase family 95 protein [Botrimarina sp.]|uniref:glycoside hydrolase family 95 protein n=1 Tax=Botrimarina sp. TaxID=2795802 RepID=UPI0032ED7C8D